MQNLRQGRGFYTEQGAWPGMLGLHDPKPRVNIRKTLGEATEALHGHKAYLFLHEAN
jgi:hypothetical protein